MDTYRAGILFLTCCVAGALSVPSVLSVQFTYPSLVAGALYSEVEEGTIVFVGDIMLGRAVERMSKERGYTYSFQGTQRLIQNADIAVANFEGVVPRVHVETPNYSFRFSVQETFMDPLREAGFNVLGLANNHTYDFGPESLAHTYDMCAAYTFVCVGESRHVGKKSAVLVDVGSTPVTIVAIHATDVTPSLEAVENIYDNAEAESDVQIAYIHWGIEYETQHSVVQETLAHALIDMGFDAIIGHHPHVVQDVEIYQGKPIFYSLGNFIFDQYLSQETEEGLVVSLTITHDALTYTLIPVSSLETPSQPHIMHIEDQQRFLTKLFERSTSTAPYISGNSIIIIAK